MHKSFEQLPDLNKEAILEIEKIDYRYSTNKKLTVKEKISNLITNWTGDPDDFKMQYLSNNIEEGYALSSQALGHGKAKKTTLR